MRITSLPWSLRALIFAAIAAADSLPYNPARILTTTNSTLAYLLGPSESSPNQGTLGVLDISKEFATDSLEWRTVSDSLPFLQDGSLIPYTPFIDGSGNITVVAGSCTAGEGSTQVWRFAAHADGSGTWTQLGTVDQSRSAGSNLTGSNFLANGVAFSGDARPDMMQTGYYLFGGMCPFASSDAGVWVSDASYSDRMLAFLPDDSTEGGSLSYDITAVASRGPPIAEAGFTMTGLSPSYSMNASGVAQSRQQDFLLLGGHTQSAFINMSNVALFSLPQESWSFLGVHQPSAARTDLAARQDATVVEPRSGHTAILSEDGSRVFVYGGWVGEVSNAAQPQLAVLHLGSEYGGDETMAWTWSVPEQSGNATPAESGIYGHASAMLPGGVMLIAGGYSISAASSDRKRASEATNDNVYLFNTTSNTWIDSYMPSSTTSAQSETNHSSGALSRTSQQAGLGVGLGVGAIGLAALICFYFWYSKRLKRQREERTRELIDGDSEISVSHLSQPFLDRGGIDGRAGEAYAGNASSNMMQAGSTGLFNNIPSPTRGLRKGLMNRPYMYHAAPRYDERRNNTASSNIHPILEQADEDGSIRTSGNATEESYAVHSLRPVERVYDSNPQEPERNLRDLQRQLKARGPSPAKDPFRDPEPNPLGSHPVSPVEGDTVRRVPTNASRHDRSPSRRPLSAEMDGSMNWMIIEDPAVASDPSSSSNGRVSPSKTDDRTSSTLSERSQRSQASSTSITRTMSTRTGALMAAAMAARRNATESESGTRSPLDERTSTMGTMSSIGRESPYYFYNADRAAATNKKRDSLHGAQNSADSFKTAHTSFAQLQDEGQALLGGRPMLDRDDPYQRALAATSPNIMTQAPVNGMSQLSSGGRRQGWVGSLRRALTIISNSERSFSMTGSTADRYEEEPEMGTSSSSPTRTRKPPLADGPRRTVSDGGALLRQKRGQSDWEKENNFPNPYRDDPDPGDWGERRTSSDERAAENEWDVEGAASKRDVQIMFTVPKARLRVVNADVERASIRSASDSAMSRAGSVQNLRGQGSRQTLRSRSDEKEKEKEKEKERLGSLDAMAEEREMGSSSAREFGR